MPWPGPVWIEKPGQLSDAEVSDAMNQLARESPQEIEKPFPTKKQMARAGYPEWADTP